MTLLYGSCIHRTPDAPLPGRPRSVRATFSPPFSHRPGWRPRSPATSQAALPRQLLLNDRERGRQQPPLRPLLQPTPTGLTAGQTQLPIRNLQPGRIGVEHIQDPLQTGPGRIATTARTAE